MKGDLKFAKKINNKAYNFKENDMGKIMGKSIVVPFVNYHINTVNFTPKC